MQAPQFLFLVACAIALAGCVGPADPGDSGAASLNVAACAPEGEDARGPSGNAPLLAPLDGTPAEIAARFAQAIGDPLASTEPERDRSDARASLWRTRSGGDVTYEHDPDDPQRFVQVSYAGQSGLAGATEAEAKQSTRGVLSRMGFPVQRLDLFERNTNPSGDVHLFFAQEFDGTPLHRTGGTFSFGRHIHILQLQPLHDLSQARVTAPEAAANASAEAWARCHLDAQGRTAQAGYAHLRTEDGGFAVANESLARVVALQYAEPPGKESHCGLRLNVLVDAQTGAVLGLLPFYCD